MIHKFSKSYGNMWALKEDLTTKNEDLLAKSKQLYEIYNQQPERKFCKICHGTKWRWQFHVQGVIYRCCDKCGHINGSHEDSAEYCRMLYENEDGCYGSYYEDVDMEKYIRRMKTIYLPKAEFLKEVLTSQNGGGTELDGLKFLDLGAGAGHFVMAMREIGLDAIGVEVDNHQVQYASKILPAGSMIHCPSESIENYLANVSVDAVTCIYAFEHIINVVEIFDAIQCNPKIRWLYFSVPMFSYSALLDSVNPNVCSRLIGPAHTHIYSNESINWICQKYGWKPLGEWRFGADIADMLRIVMVKASMQGDEEFAKVCKEKFVGMIDDLQHILDKNYFCSDIHILVEKTR